MSFVIREIYFEYLFLVPFLFYVDQIQTRLITAMLPASCICDDTSVPECINLFMSYIHCSQTKV